MSSRVFGWIRWALAAAILGYSAWQLSTAWGSLQGADLVVRPGLVMAAGGLGALALVCLALVSAVGVRAAGLPPGGAPPRFWTRWLRVWFQGYFYRYIPGKLILVVERVRLGELLGVPRAASVMLVVWESLLLMAGAGLLGGGGLLFLPLRGDEPVSGAAVASLAGVSLCGSILLWPVLRVLAARLPSLAARLPGMVLNVAPAAQVGLVGGNALAWGLLGASFALFCTATCPPDVQPPGVAMLVTWFVASYVGGQLASVAPAGLGIREGMIVAGLAGQAPASVALAWALGHRMLLTSVELVLVGLATQISLPAVRPTGGASVPTVGPP
ncbi:MAG: hypothetical protein EXR69_07555 [Myxococcales bacterium]|nr:hypothetical protein [Myxococcales bacterium]